MSYMKIQNYKTYTYLMNINIVKLYFKKLMGGCM